MSTTTKEEARSPKVTVGIVKEATERAMADYKAALDGLMHALDHAEGIELRDASRSDFVVLARDFYEQILDLVEDRAATEAHARAAGEERVPAEVVDRLLAGESPIRVWREHRGMTLEQLGEEAGLSKGYLSDLERGNRAGPVETLQAIARALRVGLDDLAPAPAAKPRRT